MDRQQYNELIELNRKIFQCRECDVHKEISSNLKDFHYNPDATVLPDFENCPDYKVISVGINPSWNKIFDGEDYQLIYRESNFENYINKVLTKPKLPGERSRFQERIATVFNILNSMLKIYEKKNIESRDIYNYLYWGNLSFCNSQSPRKRVFAGQELNSRVYDEELPNCLEKGFLRDTISLIKPSLVIFFTINATAVISYSQLIKKLFSVADDDILAEQITIPAYERAGKAVHTIMIPGRIRTTDTMFLFFPHPSFPFVTSHRKEALERACAWLEKNKVYANTP